MEIEWHGLSCFTIKGKSATIVTDPYDRKAAKKLSADVVLANGDAEKHHAVDTVSGDARLFDWPGEYEALGVVIQAVPGFDRPREKDSDKKDTAEPVLIFTMHIDGFRVCHLSNLGHKLTPEMLEAVGDVDILMVPVAAPNGLNAEKAHEVIEQIDPRIVIPMYYKELAPFLKEVGLHGQAEEKSFKIAAPSNLPQDKTEFKILEAQLG